MRKRKIAVKKIVIFGGGTLCRVVGKTFTNEKTVAGKGDTVSQIRYPENQSTAQFTAKVIRR